jgi:hypothetical protein
MIVKQTKILAVMLLYANTHHLLLGIDKERKNLQFASTMKVLNLKCHGDSVSVSLQSLTNCINEYGIMHGSNYISKDEGIPCRVKSPAQTQDI